MSGQAVGLMLRYGPDDIDLAFVCVAVADWIDPRRGTAKVGLRTLAERARCSSVHRCRDLLSRAVAEGWLVIEQTGGGRRATVYRLGTAVDNRRSGAEHSRGSSAQAGTLFDDPESRSARNPRAGCQEPTGTGTNLCPESAQPGTQTYDVLDVRPSGAVATPNGDDATDLGTTGATAGSASQGIIEASAFDVTPPRRPDFAAAKAGLRKARP
jgi:hypothetical protein